MLPEAPKGKQYRALLSRTVSGVIESALGAVKGRAKIFFVNSISACRVDDLINLHWFSRNEKEKLKNSQLASEYKNYQEYRKIAEASGDAEMLLSVKIIDKFYPLPKKIAELQKHLMTDERQATLTVATAQRGWSGKPCNSTMTFPISSTRKWTTRPAAMKSTCCMWQPPAPKKH